MKQIEFNYCKLSSYSCVIYGRIILKFILKKVKIFLKNFWCSRRIFPIYLVLLFFFIQVYNFISANLQILRRRSDKIDEMHNRYKRIVLVFVFSKKFWVNHIKFKFLRSIEILDSCNCKTQSRWISGTQNNKICKRLNKLL